MLIYLYFREHRWIMTKYIVTTWINIAININELTTARTQYVLLCVPVSACYAEHMMQLSVSKQGVSKQKPVLSIYPVTRSLNQTFNFYINLFLWIW